MSVKYTVDNKKNCKLKVGNLTVKQFQAFIEMLAIAGITEWEYSL